MKNNIVHYNTQPFDTNKLDPNKIYSAFGGGVGRFGANFALFKYGNDVIWIDVGAGFEGHNDPGINKRLPNLNLLQSFPPTIVIFTHAHEDHIGAFNWITSFIPNNTPIITSKFTFEVLTKKMQEVGLRSKDFNFYIITENSNYPLNNINLSFFFMPHSIPHLFSVGIHFLPINKKIYFTSDFKINGSEPQFKKEDIINYGPVDYLLCDSTGSLHSGYTLSEDVIAENLKKIIQSWQGRIFITLFASNIERMRNILKIADATNRKIGFLGRSVSNYLKSAFYAGEINILPQHITPPSSKDAKSIWIVSGCQGDEGSALYRIANNLIPSMLLKKGDMLIYSASVIPGNDEIVYNALNKIIANDVYIHGPSALDIPVHTSGHGKIEDIKEIVSMLQPKCIIPVHGDNVHFQAFGKIFKDINIESVKCDTIYDLSTECKNVDIIESQDFFLDGIFLHSDNQLLRNRSHIAKEGICIIILQSVNILTLSYIGVMSEEYTTEFKEQLKIEIQKIIINNTKIENSIVTKNKKLVERIFDFHEKIIQKKPYIHIEWL